MRSNIIGLVILRLRTENKLSQRQLGEKLGYSQKTVSDWEQGVTEPNLDVVTKLVKMFDVSYEELLEGGL